MFGTIFPNEKCFFYWLSTGEMWTIQPVFIGEMVNPVIEITQNTSHFIDETATNLQSDHIYHKSLQQLTQHTNAVVSLLSTHCRYKGWPMLIVVGMAELNFVTLSYLLQLSINYYEKAILTGLYRHFFAWSFGAN